MNDNDIRRLATRRTLYRLPGPRRRRSHRLLIIAFIVFGFAFLFGIAAAPFLLSLPTP